MMLARHSRERRLRDVNLGGRGFVCVEGRELAALLRRSQLAANPFIGGFNWIVCIALFADIDRTNEG